MSNVLAGDVTLLLQAAKAGQVGSQDRLFAMVYGELKKIARNRIQSHQAWISEPTTLVNDAYIKLFGGESKSWEDRHHFYWAAARAMRDILVDRARHDGAVMRGGNRIRMEFHDEIATTEEVPELLDLDEALTKLESLDPQAAKIVSMKFFAGLNREQIADALNISLSTVWRDWSFARAWLKEQL